MKGVEWQITKRIKKVSIYRIDSRISNSTFSFDEIWIHFNHLQLIKSLNAFYFNSLSKY